MLKDADHRFLDDGEDLYNLVWCIYSKFTDNAVDIHCMGKYKISGIVILLPSVLLGKCVTYFCPFILGDRDANAISGQ